MKKIVIILSIVFGVFLLSLYPTYLVAESLFNSYFNKWGDKLVSLDERGLLSSKSGAAWQDVIAGDEMVKTASGVIEEDTLNDDDSIVIIDGIAVKEFPALSIVKRLNEVKNYSNSITIKDRHGDQVAHITTEHTRADITEFPEVLKASLIAAEDGGFYKNPLGFEFNSFVRAVLRAVLRSIQTFSVSSPRGTSTLTQQVGKLFLSNLDEDGQRYVSNSVDRKVKELKLAAALRKLYTPDEILEVYLNHCVASSHGLIGIQDISKGLFDCSLDELSDAQCVYLSRMVKWGTNIPKKIKKQCHIDMKRIAPALQWDDSKVNAVLLEVDSLTFTKPAQIETEHGHLVDLANEFWLQYLNKKDDRNGGHHGDMDLLDPSSLIRKKGNLEITLSIDLGLQKFLEEQVEKRGYGNDTIIRTDVRIGSIGEDIKVSKKPKDILRKISIINIGSEFSEPGSEVKTKLEQGDTLVTNIRYRKIKKGLYRKSQFFYARKDIYVNGQYYSYCIIDSKSGELLAYYSRDRIGSRLSGLLKYRTPNGSSTAKPILNAMNFDYEIFKPYEKWIDSVSVNDDVPWKRSIIRKNGKPWNIAFANTAVRGRTYPVHNHGHEWDGCSYVFDLLATSNNIFGVESMYRLNGQMFDKNGNVKRSAWEKAQFLYRLNALESVKERATNGYVTGARLYKEMAALVGAPVDTMTAYGRKMAVSDSMYSISLGTLELSLYEQAHLFNVLYNNDIIENPKDHFTLILKDITMNGSSLSFAELDTIRKYHPFSDWNNIRPTLLGLHKRLLSNRWDGLAAYDIEYLDPKAGDENLDSTRSKRRRERYDSYRMYMDTPLSNYAKSGTTDDILRPFNEDVTSKKRTNYGLWNAVVRVDLAKFRNVNNSKTEIRDLTIACIGECNKEFTGPRDGKTLHKFITTGLLKKGGAKIEGKGYFKQYEDYLIAATPKSMLNCEDAIEDSFADTTRGGLIDRIKERVNERLSDSTERRSRFFKIKKDND